MIFKPDNVKAPNIIWVDDDYLEGAFKYIKGYCGKHTNCDGCRFNRKSVCGLMNNTHPPCDWVMPEESEDE